MTSLDGAHVSFYVLKDYFSIPFLYLSNICMYICLSHSFPCPIALPFLYSVSLLKIQLAFNRFWTHKCLFHSDIGPNFSYCKVSRSSALFSYSTRLPQTDSEEYISKRVLPLSDFPKAYNNCTLLNRRSSSWG